MNTWKIVYVRREVLQKWQCVSTRKFDDECRAVFYVEGEYFVNPCCPECGYSEAMESQGFVEFIEARGVNK